MLRRIEIVEVSPRDGLQNETARFTTADKVALIERAIAAGIGRIEAVSFVNPARVPQMADAEAVLAALADIVDDPEVTLIGLVLNQRGFERARSAGCREINYPIMVTDSFSRRNQGMDSARSIAVYRDIAAEAASAGIRASVTLSAAFGCPFEGEVAQRHVLDIVETVVADGTTDEISLADTIGVAVPSQVVHMIGAVAEIAPQTPLRCHFHNTRNTGIANAYAALEAGASVLDASIGGIGGCPFAPAATGNIATEDLVYMLERMGIETGLDLDRLIAAAAWLEEHLGRPVPALLGRAGGFPPVEQPT
jgi:hydroxymethylglutaryl-CoA lyase